MNRKIIITTICFTFIFNAVTGQQSYINLIPFSSNSFCGNSSFQVYFNSNLPFGTNFTINLKRDGQILYGISGTSSPISIPYNSTLFLQAKIEVTANGNVFSQESPILDIGRPLIYLTDNIKDFHSGNFINICQGTSKILSTKITSNSQIINFNNPIAFQWKKDNIVIPNATTSSLEIYESGLYSCDITNQSCVYNSATVRVSFLSPAGFNGYLDYLDTEGQEFECVGKSKKIKVFYNTQNTSYQWFRNDTLIHSNNIREYNIDKSGRYSVKIFDKNCVIKSEYKKITFSTGLYTPIISNHNDTLICGYGGSNNFVFLFAPLDNCDFSDYYKYSWQNQKANINLQNSGISNSTNCSLTTIKDGNFRVIYERGECTSSSKKVDVIINPTNDVKPVITIKSGFETCSISNSNGVSVNNGVKIESENGTVFWYKNGIPLNWQFPYYVAQESGTYRAIRVTSCTEVSNEIVIDFENKINKPKIYVENEKYTLCGPNDYCKIIFDLQNLGTQSGLFTRYYRNGVYMFSGSAGNNGNNPFIYVNQPGNYYVEVYNGDCFTSSNTIEIISGMPNIKIINETDIIDCSNSLVKLKLTGILNDDLGKVKWQKDNIDIPYEYDNSIYINKAGFYKATYQNNDCIASSQNFNLNIKDVPNRPDTNSYKINIKDEISLIATGCSGTVNWFNSNYDKNSISSGSSLNISNLTSNKSYFVSCEKEGCASLLRSEIKVNVCNTNTTIHSGNFNEPNIWSCGIVPNKYSNVIISNNHSIELNEKVTVKSILINGEVKFNNSGEIELFIE